VVVIDCWLLNISCMSRARTSLDINLTWTIKWSVATP